MKRRWVRYKQRTIFHPSNFVPFIVSINYANIRKDRKWLSRDIEYTIDV